MSFKLEQAECYAYDTAPLCVVTAHTCSSLSGVLLCFTSYVCTVMYNYDGLQKHALSPPFPTHAHTQTQRKQTVALYKQCGRIVHEKN